LIQGLGVLSSTKSNAYGALAKEGVNIDMILTSEIKISVVINLAEGDAAMRAVHTAFLGA
jgi:aspartate kinase